MKNAKVILSFLVGVLLTVFLFFGIKSCFSIGNKQKNTDYYILTNQITKMNKMVVMEQDFSSLQKTKINYKILGSNVSTNQIMAFTKTNAQVSYDLTKMKVEVDSINKKLIIKALPNADIRITPNVEIQSMDDSFFNRISEEDIKSATQTAKQNAIKAVDQNKLRTEGRKQLLENLNSIFVLAKALNYKVVDETKTFPEITL